MSNKLPKPEKIKKKEKIRLEKKYIKPLIVGIVLFLLYGIAVFFLLSDDEKTENKNKIVQYDKPSKDDTVAEIHVKDYGVIKVRFFESEAPKAVENFITLAKEGYYDGVSFHRVVNEYMIQGGDPTGTGGGGESIWGEEFEDEFSTKLMPIKGALCMANSGEDTNTSQFFIVTRPVYDMQYAAPLEGVIDNDLFKYYIENGGAAMWYDKHTVFGQVYEGLDIAERISKVPVKNMYKPTKEVIIEKILIKTYSGDDETTVS